MPPKEPKPEENAELNGKNVKTNQTPIGKYASVEEFTKAGLAEIVQATKSVNAFPLGAARDLYCAYPAFCKIIDKKCERILGCVSKVLKWQNIKGNIQRRQQDEQFEMLLESNDTMMEQIGLLLDELSGSKKSQTNLVLDTTQKSSTMTMPVGKGAGSWNVHAGHNSKTAPMFLNTRNIPRPQDNFSIAIDNSEETKFIPKLREKPHSLKPLAILPLYDDADNIEGYLHPYEFELLKFEVPESQLKRKNPVMPAALTATPYVFVDTVPELGRAMLEMRKHSQLAVDVEHHSYRSFMGITCLLQVSTVEKDYVFDTLKLREDLHVLNEVFTNPKIVKIFHGAQMDIEWLQRDLAIYVVNMFDTHEAAKLLNYARLSLAFLLNHYCGIVADKTLQLADWRIRPLPAELIAYARQDTHYLLYIYECICNDLLDASNQQSNLLRAVYQRSTELCMRRYEKPNFNEESYMDFYRKSKRAFDNRQLYALREIYAWRDKIARAEDESYGYVLPNHMLLQIAEALPREMQGILACCKPVPQMVRQNLTLLHQIILRARQQPLVKPVLESTKFYRVNNKPDKVLIQQDMSAAEDFRNDLPTLLVFDDVNNKKTNRNTRPENTMPNIRKPVLTIFESDGEQVNVNDDQQNEKAEWLSPYQRYLAILPVVDKEKREEALRLENEHNQRKLCPEAAIVPVVPAATKTENDDDMEGLPIKQFLKRKYEESVAKKVQNATQLTSTTDVGPTQAKRVKKEVEVTVISSDSDEVEEIPAKPNTKTKLAASEDIKSNQQKQDKPQSSGATPNAQRKKVKLLQSKRHMKQSKSHQSSDKPVQTSFDYKNVDFSRFQGGAKRARGTEIKPQFHAKGKGNKANNKKFNKLFTFSNVKNKK